MSLKAFHVLFLIAAVLLTIGFGVYSILQFKNGSPMSYLFMGVGSSILGVGLIVYSSFILKKLKRYSFF